MKTLKPIISLACLLLFTLIAVQITRNGALFFDAPIQRGVLAIRNEHLTIVLTIVTYIGNRQTITLLCIIMLLNPMWRKIYGYFLSASALVSTLFYHILKNIFKRPRPEFMPHLVIEHGYGFPSGHTMTSIVFFGLMIYLLHLFFNKKEDKKVPLYGAITLLSSLIILIPLSRIYLGVHYPSDILAGASLGISLLIALTEIHSKYLKNKIQQ